MARERSDQAEAGSHIPLPPAGNGHISIKGSAERRQSLVERLARLKAQETRGPQQPPAPSAQPVQVVEKTEEEKAAQLRERLIAERKRKILREQLLARKRAKAEGEAKDDKPGCQNGQTESSIAVAQPTSVA